MIYLDNAATTLRKPPQVIDAVARAMGSFGNSARGTHEGALTASRTIYDTRCKLAALFGCPRPDHVAFTANSTEALNIAINGLVRPGDHVLSTDLEHNSVLRPLYRLRDERGVALDFVPADRQGRIDYADLERLLRPETRAIVCTHASNLTGDAVDLARVGALAHAHGVLLVVDASQSAGVLPIDMERMHIDVLCFTGHKSLMGPQGTGGLCLRGDPDILPWKVGGTGVQTFSERQPEQLPVRLEAGTLNGHGIAGLDAALDFIAVTGMETIRAHETALMRRFYEGVRDIPGVTVYGDFTHERTAVVALNIADLDSGEVADALAEDYGIATRSGAHCAPRLRSARRDRARCASASAGTTPRRRPTRPSARWRSWRDEREKDVAGRDLSHHRRRHRHGEALHGARPCGAAHSGAARADRGLRHGMACRDRQARRARGACRRRGAGGRRLLRDDAVKKQTHRKQDGNIIGKTDDITVFFG